jgi:gamma-glutamylputrescine oxidase
MQQPLPHTGSYYAGTVNHVTDYPPLQGDKTADVCVIGAGFSGISTALHLTERGYDVTVIEANRVGWGASGRNGGEIIGGIAGEAKMAASLGEQGEQILWDMRWEGHDIIRDRVKKYDIDCDLKWGYMDVAIKPRHVRHHQSEYERLEKHGFPYEYRLLSKEEVVDTIATEEYIGGLLNMGNGHVHSLNLCIGQARAAVAQGAKIHEQSPVLEIKKGKKARVVTAHGSVTADAVVLAGNAYHFIEQDLKGRLFPVHSFVITTEPLSPEMVADINPKDIAVCDPNFVLEYFRLTGDKRLLFGARFNYQGDDTNTIREHLIPKLHRVYPQLRSARIDYAWTGTIGITLNRVPQLGKLTDNVFYMQGYSGHGVNVTHLAGKVMADAIAGTMEQFDIFSGIKPVLVPGAHTFRKPMVSLGMMYYKIKDRL